MDVAQNVTIAPQPAIMEVETQWMKNELTASKELLISHFERTFDSIVGDGQHVLADFVDWKSSGPTYTFNDLRDQLCGDAKFGFDVGSVFCLAFSFPARNPKKNGLPEQLILKALLCKGPQNYGGIVVNRFQCQWFLQHPKGSLCW